MKKLIIGMLLFVGCASVSLQPEVSIIDLPGQSKQQIYEKSRQWVTYTFTSGRAVMDYKDMSMGRIIAKSPVYLSTVMGSAMNVYMIATIDAVNGRAKITFEPRGCSVSTGRGDFDCPCDGMHLTQDALKQIPYSIITFVGDYRKYMTGGNAPAWDGR